MKLSKETLQLLKNFAGINSNLTLQPGNVLTTISQGKNIIAVATVPETFPVQFGIYDLPELLGVMSLFDSPDLEFSDRFVTIKEDKNDLRYFAADSSVLTSVPNIKQFPTADVEFDLTSQQLATVQRVASVLHVSDFSIVGDGTTLRIDVGDRSNPSSNCYTSEIGPTTKTFCADIKVENLRLMAGDYKVAIGGKKISRFQSTSGQLTYYIAIELTSSFE